MFLKLSAPVLLLAAFAAPAVASEPAPRADSSRDPRLAQPAPRADRQAPVELICRSVDIAGGDSAPMLCMTAADWRRAEQ